MGIEDNLGSLKDEASNYANKGEDWLKGEINQVEGWARENTQEAKQKLIAKAQEHGVDINGNMDVGEIKNKIKAKLRNKLPGNQ